MSAAGAECVSAPTLITSTPAAATLAMRSSVMPPDTSRRARPGRARRTASRSVVEREVVEQDDVGACAASASSSSSRFSTSHLDAARVRRALAGALDGLVDAARGDDVVVLDEHRAAEVVAVVVRPAGAHRVALERAEAGRRLAGVGDAASSSGAAARRRRRARCVAMPLMRCTKLSAVRSADKSAPRRALHRPERAPVFDARALALRGARPSPTGRGVRTPAQRRTRRTRRDRCARWRRRALGYRVDRQLGGEIAARQILGEGAIDDRIENSVGNHGAHLSAW